MINKKFILLRLESDAEGTVCILLDDNFQKICFIIEPPWKNNKANLSCIPSGTYDVEYIKRSGSGRYRDVYHIKNVKDRSGILIHCGNFAGDTEQGYRTDSLGCQLTASKIGKLSGQRAGLASRSAMHKLHAATNRQPFTLKVIHNV